jgi:hypothetical protein
MIDPDAIVAAHHVLKGGIMLVTITRVLAGGVVLCAGLWTSPRVQQ